VKQSRQSDIQFFFSSIGTIQLPGGHLEYGEDFTTCAARETLEETGLEVKPVKVVAVTNDVFEEEEKHYITLFVYCEMVDPSAVPEVRHSPLPPLPVPYFLFFLSFPND
jgi:ADP-ribose pyrophosphatase YjhB (NUDIX family)